MAITWMTCCRDRCEHAVTDEEFAAGRDSGTYRATCGHVVAAQALASPPGTRCYPCATALSTQATQPAPEGWLARALVRLRRLLADSTARTSHSR